MFLFDYVNEIILLCLTIQGYSNIPRGKNDKSFNGYVTWFIL